MSGIEIRQLPIVRAGAEDAPALTALLQANGAWLWEKGIRQWHPDVFTLADAIDNITRHEVYLVREGDTLLGTFRLQWTDPDIWGEDDGKAGYVHQFAVARAAAGTGLGDRLLDFAEDRIAEQGRSLLRLDCWGQNERLCHYYAEAGFARVRDFMAGAWHCALWERPVALRASMP